MEFGVSETKKQINAAATENLKREEQRRGILWEASGKKEKTEVFSLHGDWFEEDTREDSKKDSQAHQSIPSSLQVRLIQEFGEVQQLRYAPCATRKCSMQSV